MNRNAMKTVKTVKTVVLLPAAALLALLLQCSPGHAAMRVYDENVHETLLEGNEIMVHMKDDLTEIRDFTENIEEYTEIMKDIAEFNDAVNPGLWADKDFTDLRTVKTDVDEVFSQFANLTNKMQMFFALYHQPEWFDRAAGTPVDQVNRINQELSNLYDKAYDEFYEENVKGIGTVDSSRSLMEDNLDWANAVNSNILGQDEVSEKDIQVAILTGIMRLVNTTGAMESIVAQNTNITLQQALREAEEKEFARRRGDVLVDGEGVDKANPKNSRQLRAGYGR